MKTTSQQRPPRRLALRLETIRLLTLAAPTVLPATCTYSDTTCGGPR